MSRLVALTGATGFIGRHVVARLQGEGWRVRALVRRRDADLAACGVEMLTGSLEDPASLGRLVDGAAAVVHGAAVISACRREAFFAVNTEGTRRLAEAARTSSRVRTFVLLSSLAAREPQLSAYAASKRGAEEIVAGRPPAPDWCIVRPPAVYGPGDRATLHLFRQLWRGIVLVPAGAGRRLSLLHVSDLAEAVVRLLAHPLPQGSILEPDDGRPGGYAWPDLAETAARSLGRPVHAVPVHRSMLVLPAHVNALYARATGRPRLLTPDKLRELFHPDWVCRPDHDARPEGWTPRVRLEEGVRATLAWYRQQGWL